MTETISERARKLATETRFTASECERVLNACRGDDRLARVALSTAASGFPLFARHAYEIGVVESIRSILWHAERDTTTPEPTA